MEAPARSAIRHCKNHSDRQAYAVCKSCHSPICAECATRWNGINYCQPCLLTIRDSASIAQPKRTWMITMISVILISAIYVAAVPIIGPLMHWIMK